LNWILHNDSAAVEKSMEDIKLYMDTMYEQKDTEMKVFQFNLTSSTVLLHSTKTWTNPTTVRYYAGVVKTTNSLVTSSLGS
jgi:hypothetical protein